MRPLLVVVLAVLSLGFVITIPETPKMKADRLKREAELRSELASRFELAALRDFLAFEIKSRGSFENVKLDKSVLAPEWTVDETGVTCGDWRFQIASPKQDDFQLQWGYGLERQKDGRLIQKCVILDCHRIDRRTFHVTGIRTLEEEIIELDA